MKSEAHRNLFTPPPPPPNYRNVYVLWNGLHNFLLVPLFSPFSFIFFPFPSLFSLLIIFSGSLAASPFAPPPEFAPQFTPEFAPELPTINYQPTDQTWLLSTNLSIKCLGFWVWIYIWDVHCKYTLGFPSQHNKIFIPWMCNLND